MILTWRLDKSKGPISSRQTIHSIKSLPSSSLVQKHTLIGPSCVKAVDDKVCEGKWKLKAWKCGNFIPEDLTINQMPQKRWSWGPSNCGLTSHSSGSGDSWLCSSNHPKWKEPCKISVEDHQSWVRIPRFNETGRYCFIQSIYWIGLGYCMKRRTKIQYSLYTWARTSI